MDLRVGMVEVAMASTIIAACTTPAADAGREPAGGAEVNSSPSDQLLPAFAPPTSWRRVNFPSGNRNLPSYSVAAPDNMRGGPTQGIDSDVGELSTETLRLSFDYGRYGGALNCGVEPCQLRQGRLGDRLIQVADFGATTGLPSPFRFRLGAAIQVVDEPAPGATLRVTALCASSSDCELARDILLTITFSPAS